MHELATHWLIMQPARPSVPPETLSDFLLLLYLPVSFVLRYPMTELATPWQPMFQAVRASLVQGP